MKTKLLATCLSAAIVLTGCESLDGNYRGAAGAGIGAVAGGVIGHQMDSRKGRYVGAIAGALTGAAIGSYMDRQAQQLQSQMQGTGVNVQRVDDATLLLNMPGDLLFATDQYQIIPAFYQTLSTIANSANQYPDTIIHIYGHTDNVGTAEYNQGLSERRANAVAQSLVQQGGVNPQRIVTRGYGLHRPRADNSTPQGRQQNRRVEIYFRVIDANNPQAAYSAPY
ncbi:MAG: OmpA family protein [Cardiobacteriaceae bacterium]|nr:OmpA family protein [Cardiobacteriaceae bacterium]